MSPSHVPAPTRGPGRVTRTAGSAADATDRRLHAAAGLRHQLNKVFPTHWSFLLTPRSAAPPRPARGSDVYSAIEPALLTWADERAPARAEESTAAESR